MKLLPKWLRLPTPKELGRSESNSLPSRFFVNKEGEYTWEDYEKEMKNKYPVKYFLEETVGTWFGIKHRKIKDFIYWIKSHTIRKYHLLDLRQLKNSYIDDQYRYGWIDSDTQMLYALFNILVNFCEKEQNIPKYIEFLREENKSESENILGQNWNEQIKMYEEILALYNYWKVERPKKQKYMSEVLHKWSESRKNTVHGDKELFDEYTKLEKDLLEEEENSMIRLIKVRCIMWT